MTRGFRRSATPFGNEVGGALPKGVSRAVFGVPEGAFSEVDFESS